MTEDAAQATAKAKIILAGAVRRAAVLEPLEMKKVPIRPEITYDDFKKIDMRVATIIEAEAVPKSEKLVKLRVQMGEERTIVAGIAKNYKPQDLVGKQIVVVANLKPTKLMGVESHGMLLATDGESGLALLTFDKPLKAGSEVR